MEQKKADENVVRTSSIKIVILLNLVGLRKMSLKVLIRMITYQKNKRKRRRMGRRLKTMQRLVWRKKLLLARLIEKIWTTKEKNKRKMVMSNKLRMIRNDMVIK